MAMSSISFKAYKGEVDPFKGIPQPILGLFSIDPDLNIF